jgi:hypothetical protein
MIDFAAVQEHLWHLGKLGAELQGAIHLGKDKAPILLQIRSEAESLVKACEAQQAETMRAMNAT